MLGPKGGSMSKVKLVIHVSPEQRVALEKLHAKTGAPMSELVRRALAEYLQKAGSK